MLSQTEVQATAAVKQDSDKISRLINSIFFFIDCIFILEKNNGYRLIAVHQRRVLTDRTYPTLIGAKIAFSKLYRDKAWKESVKAQWTDFYPPDRLWLDEHLKIAEKPKKAH